MKAYVLTEQDFELLLASIDRNPRFGLKGGSSKELTVEEQKAHDDAYCFYNYQIRTWIEKVKQ